MNYESIINEEKNIKNLRTKIEVLYDIEKLELLLEEGEELLRVEPNDEYALYMMGLACIGLDKIEQAEVIALSYLKLYPTNADSHALYGEVLYSKGNYKQSIDEYNRAIELSPMESYLYYKLAINIYSIDKVNVDKSIELVLHALELEPDNAIYYSYLSEQYINAGRLEEAYNECSKALELGPDIGIVRGQYGKIQMYFQNFNEAEKHIRESLRINPMDMVTHEYLKRLTEYKEDMGTYFRTMIEYYLKFEKVIEAESIALKYIGEYPSSAIAHQLYGQILYYKNRFEQSIKEFYTAINLGEIDEFSYYMLSVSLININKKNIVEAIELMMKALEISPSNGRFHAFLGYLYLESYNFEAAESECLKALEYNPKDAYIQAQWAQIQLISGNLNEAKEHINEALGLNPNDQVVKDIFRIMKRDEENISLYLRQRIWYHSHSLKKYPQGKKGHLILAKMLIQKRKIKKSICEFNKYIVLRPDDKEGFISFVNLLFKEMGQKKALVHLKKLYKKCPDIEIISNYFENLNEDIVQQEINLEKDEKKWLLAIVVVIIALIKIFLMTL